MNQHGLPGDPIETTVRWRRDDETGRRTLAIELVVRRDSRASIEVLAFSDASSPAICTLGPLLVEGESRGRVGVRMDHVMAALPLAKLLRVDLVGDGARIVAAEAARIEDMDELHVRLVREV